MRMPGLDFLRAIAIAWVMLFHSFLVGGLGERWEWLSRYGWMGVDLFFVLSGFLIGQQLLAPLARGETLSFRDFYLRRAFRILPAFWAVLALYLLWPGFREAPGMEAGWKFALFVVNLDIDYLANAAFSHAWSLCVEEHFYLLFPLLAWALAGRVQLRHVVVLALVIVAGGIALRSAVWLHDTAAAPERNWFVEDIYYPTWCRLDGLLAGVLLAALKVHRPLQWDWLAARANAVSAAGIALLAVALWLFGDRTGLVGNSVGWPVLSLALALLVCAGASRHGLIGRWHVPGAAWLAAISYSLYLVHKPVYHLVSQAWGEALGGRGIGAFAAYAVASVAAGAMLHYLVERPGLALRHRCLARVGPADATAATPG